MKQFSFLLDICQSGSYWLGDVCRLCLPCPAFLTDVLISSSEEILWCGLADEWPVLQN